VGEPEGTPTPVLLVLGPGAAAEVVAHTHAVLSHFGIVFREAGWHDCASLLEGGVPGLQVIVFATAVAYTDEHLALPVNVVAPVLRVLTDPAPPTGQVLSETSLMATVGFGIPGAVNAGLLAVQILATSDAALRDLLRTRPYTAR
jgi:hypothetical protein